MSWGNNPLKFDEINLFSSSHKFITLHIELNTPEGELKMKSLSCVRLIATPWTAVYQTPPSMDFSKQEYWTELPFPSPEDLPDSVIKPRSPTLLTDYLFTVWDIQENFTGSGIMVSSEASRTFLSFSEAQGYIMWLDSIQSWNIMS